MNINQITRKIMKNEKKEITIEDYIKVITGAEKAKLTVSIQKLMKDNDITSIAKNLKINKTQAARFIAFLELKGKISNVKPEKKLKLDSPIKVAKYAEELLRFCKQEKFLAILLDTQGNMMSTETISKGSKNAILLTPDLVFKQPVIQQATAIVIAHNHPSGDPTPSNKDIETTKELIKAGKLMNIKVVDHVIVGDGKTTSMKAQGYIK